MTQLRRSTRARSQSVQGLQSTANTEPSENTTMALASEVEQDSSDEFGASGEDSAEDTDELNEGVTRYQYIFTKIILILHIQHKNLNS